MDDIEGILEVIRQNSVILSREHRKNYIKLKSSLKLFRLPIIILSALNSVFSIGLQPFVVQTYISLINCMMALLVGVIGSVELYLQINKSMEISLVASRDYSVLYSDIFKYLNLKRENRDMEAKVFLDTSYGRYIKIGEMACVLKRRIEDRLSVIPETRQSLAGLVPLSPSQGELEVFTDTSSDDLPDRV